VGGGHEWKFAYDRYLSIHVKLKGTSVSFFSLQRKDRHCRKYTILGEMFMKCHIYRVYKKKVIELQRAIVSELLCVWTRFFHIRKDHAFSWRMISSSCQMDKKWANTNPIKNVSQNRIFSPLRVRSKTIENQPPLGFKSECQ
jgi:hypothetical protein